MDRRNLFIYGSCVSRDTSPYLERLGYQLGSYVARQSVISAASFAVQAVPLIDENLMPSRFQRESFAGDIQSSLMERLNNSATEIDCVLMDFVDERGGIWIDSENNIATNTMEFTISNFINQWKNEPRLVKFGSDEHFLMWKESFELVVDRLSTLALDSKTFIIQNSWANESIEGENFPFGGSKLDPNMMNLLYRRYYDYAESILPNSIIRVPRELCVTTRKHRWGIAAFHYIEEFYDYISIQIDQKLLTTNPGDNTCKSKE